MKNLQTIKDKVEYLYGISQEAVDSNDILAKLYEENFGVISESVFRAGRFLRSDRAKNKRFFRSPIKAENDLVLMEINIDYWVKGVADG